ncbi:MAG: hypothetical protein LBN94_00795 [Puniceicoccales bacterium]|nr:hypothetical protein [Puniceicoccales bacterium]
MNEDEKKAIAMMSEKARETLDAMGKLFLENPDVPQDIREKALHEIQKTEKEITRITTIHPTE